MKIKATKTEIRECMRNAMLRIISESAGRKKPSSDRK